MSRNCWAAQGVQEGCRNYDTFIHTYDTYDTIGLSVGPTFGKASPGTSPSWRSREHQKLNGRHKEHRQSLVSVGRETCNTWNKGNVSVSATRLRWTRKVFPHKGKVPYHCANMFTSPCSRRACWALRASFAKWFNHNYCRLGLDWCLLASKHTNQSVYWAESSFVERIILEVWFRLGCVVRRVERYLFTITNTRNKLQQSEFTQCN